MGEYIGDFMDILFNCIFYAVLAVYFVLLIWGCVKKNKKLLIINTVFIPVIIALIVLKFVFFPVKIESISALSEFGIYIAAGLLLLIMVLISLFFGADNGTASKTKAVSYGGICVAVAFVLSYAKIEVLGGSVTLASALPLVVYAYIFGTRKGIMLGVIFGVLQFVQKPTIYHPAQVILDYVLAFGGIGLAGIARNMKSKPVTRFIVGASVGLFTRYVAHVISGYFVFYVYCPKSWNPFLYSVVFNMNVLIDLAIVILVGIFLFLSKAFVKVLSEVNPDPMEADNWEELSPTTNNDEEDV